MTYVAVEYLRNAACHALPEDARSSFVSCAIARMLALAYERTFVLYGTDKAWIRRVFSDLNRADGAMHPRSFRLGVNIRRGEADCGPRHLT